MLSSMMLTFTFKLGVSCLARSSSVPAEGNINLCTQHSQLTECALHIYGALNRNTTVASQLVTTQQRLKQPTNKLTSVTDISQLADEDEWKLHQQMQHNQKQITTVHPGQLSLAIPLWAGAMSTSNGHGHCQGRNGEFCITAGRVTKTAGTSQLKGAEC